jgi:hypothetical protein
LAVSTAEARAQILTDLAAAINQLAVATACLGEAYELLDDATADRLEESLFRPVQKAYGRAKRTQSQFAERVGLVAPALEAPSPGLPSQGVKVFVSRSVAAAQEAEQTLAALQDSMLPIEVGDAELRSGLAEVRDLIDGQAGRARGFLSQLGR